MDLNPNDSAPDWDELTAYLAATLSPSDRAEFERRLERDAALAARVARLQGALDAATPAYDNFGATAELARLWRRLERHGNPAQTTRRATSLSSRPTTGKATWRMSGKGPTVAAYGAVAMLTLVIGLALGVVMRRGDSVFQRTHIQQQTYSTRTGERTTVRLADGSTVILAPVTTLTIGTDPSTRSRTVTLVGQARFDIVPNAHSTFVVQIGKISARVLGTRFDVSRYATDATGQVAVFSGRVVANAGQSATVLNAGMIGRFTDSSATMVTSGDPRTYADWTEGRLVFDDVPVPAMLATLQRWMGYEFLLTDSTLARQHVTTAFTIGEHREMLRQLGRLLDVNMTFKDSVVILRQRDGARGRIHGKTRDVRDLVPLLKGVGR